MEAGAGSSALANGALATSGSIQFIVCENVRTAERSRIRGRWFLDSTGDGALGALVGADFDQTPTGHMGASNLWNIQCLCEDEDPLSSELEAACELAIFPRCPWAVDLTEKPFPGRTQGSTDAQAGEVTAGRVLPRDYVATVLHCLGVDPETTVPDAQQRPIPLSRGRVLENLLV